MNQGDKILKDWLFWRPSTSNATASAATTATEPETVATAATVAVAAQQRSYRWRITENGETREVIISGNPTAAEVQGWYRRAWIEPLTQEQSTARARLKWNTEASVRAYLLSLGETDPVVIGQVLAEFRHLTR